MNDKLANAALYYIEHGFKVFPVKPDKTPLTNHGLKDATQTQAGVKEFWKQYPDANIGVVTDGFIVLDFDVGKHGLESKLEIEAKYSQLPKTRVHRTGGGGEHWIYKQNGRAIRNTTMLGGYSGVDIRANGGYIVAPPSSHLSGKFYEVIDDSPIVQAPDWLIELSATKQTPQTEPAAGKTIIPEGTRDATLAKFGGSMRYKGIGATAIEAALLEINRTQCQPPLPDSDVKRIAKSVSRYTPNPDGVRDYVGGAPGSGEVKPNNLTEYNLTDAGNAEYFTNDYGNILRYDHRRSRWLEWHTHCWRPENDGHIMRLALKAARDRYKNAANIPDLELRKKVSLWAIQSEQRARLEACIAIAKSLKPIADSGECWDNDNWLFCVQNGVLDLRTGVLRDGKPEDSITMQSPVVYDSSATAPRWEQFLNEVFCEDADLISWLQRYIGYFLTGDTREQVVGIAYGTGANGKSILLAVLRHQMGDYGYDAPFSTFELTQRAAIPNDLAALVGKRLVTASETNEGTRLNEARVKALSGQDTITARFLHAEFFTFQPVAKFFLAVNHRPNVHDDSYGFWRRVRLVPFNREFKGGQEDKMLLEKLIAESSGILNWLVRGCLEWQEKGLQDTPQCVNKATEEYQTESDPISQFLLDECAFNKQAQVKASRIYKGYLKWCDEQSLREKEKLTSTAFGRRVSQKYKKTHNREGTFYQGLGMKCDGFVTGFEATEHFTELKPNFEISCGNNCEMASQPVTRHKNPSQEKLPVFLPPVAEIPDNCPVPGCNLLLELNESMTGYECKKGHKYVLTEALTKQ